MITPSLSIGVKNMVCDRCILTVKNIAEQLNLSVNTVKLGELNLAVTPKKETLTLLKKELEKNGFEFITDQKEKLIIEVKSLLIELIYGNIQIPQNEKISSYLQNEVGLSYSKLSQLFSKKGGKTIEQYIIELKIERAKELLSYKELNISEVSIELCYSTAQHFSRQFKTVTGITPSQFIQKINRKKLDTF